MCQHRVCRDREWCSWWGWPSWWLSQTRGWAQHWCRVFSLDSPTWDIWMICLGTLDSWHCWYLYHQSKQIFYPCRISFLLSWYCIKEVQSLIEGLTGVSIWKVANISNGCNASATIQKSGHSLHLIVWYNAATIIDNTYYLHILSTSTIYHLFNCL